MVRRLVLYPKESGINSLILTGIPHIKIMISNNNLYYFTNTIFLVIVKSNEKNLILYIFFSGIILHMIFAGENTFINYLINTSSNPGERTLLKHIPYKKQVKNCEGEAGSIHAKYRSFKICKL